MEQEKRGLCPYDDKRYLLADLPDGRPNPNTHAYGHCDLAAEEQSVLYKSVQYTVAEIENLQLVFRNFVENCYLS